MVTILFIAIIIIFIFAYRFYGKKIGGKVLGIDDSRKTPAYTVNDGIDYVATKTPVLFGHHFSSIAGAGPIIGPIIVGVAYGWLPAILWIIIGSIFIGGIHDMTAIFASIRHQGRSIAEIAKEYISPLAYRLMLIFIWLDLIYIISVFTDLTSNTFMENGSVATSSISYCIIAILFGIAIYRLKLPLLPSTAIAVFLVFLFIYIGIEIPINISSNFFISPKNMWNILLLVYCFIASSIPVWVLLQPRDYLSSFLLYSMVILGALGILVGNYTFNYPLFIGYYSDYLGNMFPIVFITIACGAISGFHALVGSGTTSKQISKESDTAIIGYGGMLAEGLVAVIAVTTVIILMKNDPITSKQPLEIFASGIGTFVSKLGIPQNIGSTFGLLALSTFILTSLDTSTRISRYIFQEFFNLKGSFTRFPATFFSLILPAVLVFMQLKDSSGKPIPSWKAIWPVFGAANQLLAALVLIVLSVWLKKMGKNIYLTFIPMIFMLTVTLWSLIILIMRYKITIIGIIAILLLLLSFFLAFEAVKTSIWYKKNSQIKQ